MRIASSLGLPKRVLAVAAAAAMPFVAHAAERPFYAGKTLNLIVGLPPGGGADTYARLLARHLPRHIPGEPTIVVQNMPGAGSLKAVVYLNSAAPADGTAIGTFSSSLINETLTSPNRVPVDFRNYAWIGNISEDVRVCYVWAASGIKTWGDLLARPKEIFMGATAPGTAGTTDSAMLRDLFGIKIRQVQGYAGSADKRLAVERGEVDGDCGGWTFVPDDWRRDNKVNVLVRLSPRLVPGMDPNVPFGGDLVKDARDRKLYDFLIAPERLGRLFMASRRVPAARIAILRAAFDATVADPEFLADAARMRLLVTPMTGDEVTARIGELYETPPDIVARAKTIIAD